MKKKVYAIVLAGVLAFALTACSRPEDSGSEPESSAAPTTAPTTAVTTTEAPTSGVPEPSLTRPVTSTSCERAESVS